MNALELFACSTTSTPCVAFRNSLLAVVATPRLLHLVRGDNGAVTHAYRSARSDIVHVEFANSFDDDVIVVVLANARIVRVHVKRTRGGDEFVSSLDDFPVIVSLNTSIKSIDRVCAGVWLARLVDGSSRLVRAAGDSFGWLDRCDDVDLTRPLYVRDGLVHQLHVDMHGEAIVCVQAVVIRDKQMLCVVGAFGTVAFVANERVWRLSVGLSRCMQPCAVTDDAELLLVNNGERLVAVSLRDALPVDFDASPYSRVCIAPTHALRRSVPVALELRRSVRPSDAFVAVAVLACGTVLTLGRELLQPETFPIAAAPRQESFQQVLRELDAAAETGRRLSARNAELTASLGDLAGALSIAPSVADRSVFQCRLQPSMGQFSVFDERAIIGIHVTYSGAPPLSERWSLAVRTRRTEPRHAARDVATTHHVVPLTKLPLSGTANATWTLVIGVPFAVASSIAVSIDVVFVPLSDRGWVVPLIDEQLFDALDFCKLAPPTSSLEPSLAHSAGVALHSDWQALLGNAAADERAAQLLTLLVPICTKRAAPLLLLANGELVRLRVAQADDFQLAVLADCASALTCTVIRTCLSRRIASIRRDKTHAAVAAQLSHYALGGAGVSANEAVLGIARAVKQCADATNAIRDDVDLLIARHRAFAANDATAPTTVHLRQSVSERVRARERLEEATRALRTTVGQSVGM